MKLYHWTAVQVGTCRLLFLHIRQLDHGHPRYEDEQGAPLQDRDPQPSPETTFFLPLPTNIFPLPRCLCTPFYLNFHFCVYYPLTFNFPLIFPISFSLTFSPLFPFPLLVFFPKNDRGQNVEMRLGRSRACLSRNELLAEHGDGEHSRGQDLQLVGDLPPPGILIKHPNSDENISLTLKTHLFDLKNLTPLPSPKRDYFFLSTYFAN
jgi:hypothetical protein